LIFRVLLDSRSTNNPPYAEAAALFRVAAEENVPQALHSLALLYEYGLGVEQNFEEARSLYAQAVEQHHVESMYNLAMMYAQGRGMPQDFPRARTLLEGAAQTNHAPSIYYIGVFKTYGYGCQVEYNQAINWFERAAGLDDYRVSAKAAKAAHELRTKVDAANLQNEQLLDKYQERAQVSGR
jgi:TPR repeat protein